MFCVNQCRQNSLRKTKFHSNYFISKLQVYKSYLKIGTRLVVLNSCNEGMLLLAWLKNTGGTFDVDAIPLKNLNSDGFPALIYVGLPPRYDFIIVCGITV